MLIDRGHALHSLREILQECVNGRGHFVMASGGLASGKTALMQEFQDVALDAGALVLSAAGARAETHARHGVLSQLCRSAALPGHLRELVESGLGGERSDSEAENDSRARELCDALLETSRAQPVVIAVDDVQFADPATLQTLLRLRRRIRSSRVVLLFTEWTCPANPRSRLLTEYTQQPHCRIVLRQLSERGTAELLAQELGDAATPELVARCSDLSGGNPLLIKGFVEDVRTGPPHRHGPVGSGVLGVAYRRAVRDCLHRWDRALSDVAEGVAVLGSSADPKRVAQLLDVTPECVGQSLNVLEMAGLARGCSFRHPEISAAVLEGLPPGVRGHLHAKAAELLYESGAETLEITRHIVSADQLPGPWAVPILRQAARKAATEEEVELTVKGLELALRDCEERDQLFFRTELVEVAWRVNPLAAVRHLPALRQAMAEGRLGQRDLLSLIRHLLWQGDTEGAAEPVAALLESVGTGDTRLVAQLSMCYELVHGVPYDHPDRSTVLAGNRKPPFTPSWSRATATRSQNARNELMHSAERILQGQISDTVPEASALAILIMDREGHSRRAQYWFETLMAEAVRQGAVTWQALLGTVSAHMALRRGDMATAAARAEVALGLLHAQSWGVLIGFPLSVLVLAHTAMGNHERAGKELERAVPDAMATTVSGLQYLRAGGHYHLATGRPFAAIEEFERCGALAREGRMDIPGLIPWRSDLAQAHLQLGQPKKARALATEQLELPAAARDAWVRGISLRLVAAGSPPAERVPRLQDAIQSLEHCGDRLELARALADLGQTHQALDELDQARLVARRADQEAKACSAEVAGTAQAHRPPSERPRREPAADAVQGEGMVALSEAERKVAALAAFGHTNREIGRKLYITVSTVEQHLTRAYRKLNVNRRTDLPTELAAHQEAA
ncbi:AAA family ATPase [Streptomyces spiramenti]|uniref:AAA family ATPase n=1 Tax=Streptomyces spiramenti TaxID=2720606 RepID=A0ABX1AJ53_9ACTN|nr:LuxR family transcriptional regulator [Streptomyces spiramenti]NJP66265.1 AAA family ATPase [Streptomyces spiramenti]